MLRGVNRRIIEINECESKYFERAIFIIRTDAPDKSESALKGEADRLLNDAGRPPKTRKRKYLISRKALWLITALSTLAAIALAIANFI